MYVFLARQRGSTRELYNRIEKYSWDREVMPGRRGNISFGVPAKLNTFCSHFCVKWNLGCLCYFCSEEEWFSRLPGYNLNKVWCLKWRKENEKIAVLEFELPTSTSSDLVQVSNQFGHNSTNGYSHVWYFNTPTEVKHVEEKLDFI